MRAGKEKSAETALHPRPEGLGTRAGEQVKIKGGDWTMAPEKGLGEEPARMEAVRACWAAGLFGTGRVGASPGFTVPTPTSPSRRPLDGFKRAARYDDARRRSIWYRQNPDGSLEMRAGREGGDDHVRLAPGEVVTQAVLVALADLLRCNAWATELTEDASSLDEVDEHVGPFGLRAQNRALDAAQTDRLCRANMVAGRPWGCAEVDALAFHGVDTRSAATDEQAAQAVLAYLSSGDEFDWTYEHIHDRCGGAPAIAALEHLVTQGAVTRTHGQPGEISSCYAITLPAKLTACGVSSFRSVLLERKRHAFSLTDQVRGTWLLSDGREVLLTRYILMVADGHRVYVGAYPAEAGAGLAVQCVMAVPAGRDPFPLQAKV